ncbi:MAG: glutamate ligase domain-containing protein, partial [Gammaproteobacteria bacterium]
AALPDFASVRRRLELRGRPHGISVYDDFAHHPTAIAATIGALRATVDRGRVLAVLEPRSNTMVMGVHKDTLARSVEGADRVYILLPPELHWDIRQAMAANEQVRLFTDSEDLLRAVTGDAREGDHVLIMSNGAFAGIHERIIDRLEQT